VDTLHSEREFCSPPFLTTATTCGLNDTLGELEQNFPVKDWQVGIVQLSPLQLGEQMQVPPLQKPFPEQQPGQA